MLAMLSISVRLATTHFDSSQIVVLTMVSMRVLTHPLQRYAKVNHQDPNKRVVLECGGVELLLRCATKKLWPDIVTTALWNICAQSEVLGDTKTYIADGSGSSSPKCLTAIEPDIASIARFQLGLRSTGECDDLDQDDVLEDQPRETRRHTNIVCTLLNLADSLNDDSWKEMVSELLGHATWHSKSAR